MKRYISLLLCAVMVLGLFGCTQPQVPTEPSQSESPSQSVEPSLPQQTHLDLWEYDSAVDTSVLTEETIFALLREADDLAAQYDFITISTKLSYFFNYLGFADVYVSSTTVILEKAAFAKVESYAYTIFLGLMLQEYRDCAMEYDYLYDPYKMSRPWFHEFYICPEFRTSGYVDILVYRYAIDAGEAPRPELVWLVAYNQIEIVGYYSTGEKTPDLYEQYRNS